MGGSQSVPVIHLDLCPNNELTQLYFNHGQFHEGDSGLDLYIPVDVKFKSFENQLVNLGIRCQAYTLKNDLWSRFIRWATKSIPEKHKVYTGYYLYPRSSISKTNLVMSNSVGVIDKAYTGELKAPLKNVSSSGYTLSKDTRLFQIVGPNQNPLKFQIVKKLRTTVRGDGGFGSTGGTVTETAVNVEELTPRVTINHQV